MAFRAGSMAKRFLPSPDLACAQAVKPGQRTCVSLVEAMAPVTANRGARAN
jgi:hypothetical protein